MFFTSLSFCSRYFVMLVFILFLAMPAISTKPQNMETTEMDDVTFTCNSVGEPAVTYEWFYTSTSSGRLFCILLLHLLTNSILFRSNSTD